MKNRFIIGTGNFSVDDVRVFVEYLKCYNCAWWHWIQNIWLVIDYSNTLTAQSIAEKLNEINKMENNMVFQVNDFLTWYGFGPTKKDNNYFQWFHETWLK